MRLIQGWIRGKLPGPGGRLYRLEKEPLDFSVVALAKRPPNLVLHTTESPDLSARYRSWDYPPQFAVGDHRIVQLFPVWAQGKATDTQDAYAMQIEIAGYSKQDVWLPGKASLHPLVALVAFLHRRGLITSGLKRPEGQDWPLHMRDAKGTCYPATDCYHRRKAGLWPRVPGVYGHGELPDDEHWDPGGFDYPRFFRMVQAVLEAR